MSLRINNNVEAQDTLRNLTSAQNAFSLSMQRLSSGKRINSAADDAAGYAISSKLLSQSNGLNQAQSNAQDGISMIQTATGGLQTTMSLLQRMNQLAVQSANDTNETADRGDLQSEADQIANEVTQIANTTQFNNQNLLDGTDNGGNGFTLQVGANAGQNIVLHTTANGAAGGTGFTAGNLGVDTANAGGAADVDLTTQAGANAAITTIQSAIATVSTASANFGAVQNRLTDAISNLSIGSENMTSAYSAITNVNMAQESTNLATAQILQQSSISMLAQANQAPQGVLKLLG